MLGQAGSLVVNQLLVVQWHLAAGHGGVCMFLVLVDIGFVVVFDGGQLAVVEWTLFFAGSWRRRRPRLVAGRRHWRVHVRGHWLRADVDRLAPPDVGRRTLPGRRLGQRVRLGSD